jgi:hypothetical protein
MPIALRLPETFMSRMMVAKVNRGNARPRPGWKGQFASPAGRWSPSRVRLVGKLGSILRAPGFGAYFVSLTSIHSPLHSCSGARCRVQHTARPKIYADFLTIPSVIASMVRRNFSADQSATSLT